MVLTRLGRALTLDDFKSAQTNPHKQHNQRSFSDSWHLFLLLQSWHVCSDLAQEQVRASLYHCYNSFGQVRAHSWGFGRPVPLCALAQGCCAETMLPRNPRTYTGRRRRTPPSSGRGAALETLLLSDVLQLAQHEARLREVCGVSAMPRCHACIPGFG